AGQPSSCVTMRNSSARAASRSGCGGNMSDITHWFTIACAVYVAKGIVVALICAVGLALEREWRWIPFGAFVGGSLWPLTLVAWSIELWEWWERRSEVQPVEAWDDTT